MSVHAGEDLDHVLEGAGDADDALRRVVAVLVRQPGIVWAAIHFLERGQLVLGPAAGDPDESRRIVTPIVYRGDPVGELLVDGEAEQALLERVAAAISTYVLLGWDTGGERWEP